MNKYAENCDFRFTDKGEFDIITKQRNGKLEVPLLT